VGADRRQEITIGWFAAQALFAPGKFHIVALSLAGDELTQLEGVVIFEVVGGGGCRLRRALLALR